MPIELPDGGTFSYFEGPIFRSLEVLETTGTGIVDVVCRYDKYQEGMGLVFRSKVMGKYDSDDGRIILAKVDLDAILAFLGTIDYDSGNNVINGAQLKLFNVDHQDQHLPVDYNYH